MAVGIGTPARGQEFCDHIGFPRECLYTDPESQCYEAIGLYKSVSRTFFNPATPYAMLDRIKRDGMRDLFEVLGRWKVWMPPKQDQAFQQGGQFVFAGKEAIFEHFDQATGDHADMNEVLGIALLSKVP